MEQHLLTINKLSLIPGTVLTHKLIRVRQQLMYLLMQIINLSGDK